jgi:hypothetical protein
VLLTDYPYEAEDSDERAQQPQPEHQVGEPVHRAGRMYHQNGNPAAGAPLI